MKTKSHLQAVLCYLKELLDERQPTATHSSQHQ